MVRTENGKTLKVQGKGRVEFTDDDSDVKSLEPGGRFSVETANGWFSGFTASRFEATAARDGSIKRAYAVDGKTVGEAATAVPSVAATSAVRASARPRAGSGWR